MASKKKDKKSKSGAAVEKTDKKSSKKIRYALVGLGHIAQTAVLPGFVNAKENSEITALVSDDEEKLRKLAKKYKIKNTYTYAEYEECLKSGEIDAVYIALPNHLHREYTERAAKAGIHVLCEKPLAVTAEDCQAMIDVCQKNNVKLMTAYRLHFERANLEAVRIAQSGDLGDLKAFNSTFGYTVDADNIRLYKEEVGGGPVYDIGVYCINASRYLFRDVPTEVYAIGTKTNDKRTQKIDDTVSAVLRYPGERTASFTVSFTSAPVAFFEVLGTKGVMCLEQAYEYTETRELEIEFASGKSKSRSFKKTDQFGPELIYFSDCILENRSPEPGGLEGLIDVKIVEAILESIDTGRPVKVSLEKKRQNPSPAQEITRRAVREPKPVNAKNPSAN